MKSLENMSNFLLLEAFMKAKELKLESDFCDLMESEIINRELTVPFQKNSQA